MGWQHLMSSRQTNNWLTAPVHHHHHHFIRREEISLFASLFLPISPLTDSYRQFSSVITVIRHHQPSLPTPKLWLTFYRDWVTSTLNTPDELLFLTIQLWHTRVPWLGCVTGTFLTLEFDHQRKVLESVIEKSLSHELKWWGTNESQTDRNSFHPSLGEWERITPETIEGNSLRQGWKVRLPFCYLSPLLSR